MDRQNRFFTGDIPGLPVENTDTASPKERIDKELRDRLLAEEDGYFGEPLRPAFAPASYKEQLLRRIEAYSIAMAQATLHLDTRPGDPSLLSYYNTYRRRLTDTVRAYEKRYGPLSPGFGGTRT